jgi:hypothetical protein
VTTAEQTPTVTWGVPAHRYTESTEVSVKVAGVANVQSRDTKRWYEPYSVLIKHTRFSAQQPWIAEARVHGHKVGGSRLVGTDLTLNQLVDVPQWLTDLIEQAAPKETP